MWQSIVKGDIKEQRWCRSWSAKGSKIIQKLILNINKIIFICFITYLPSLQILKSFGDEWPDTLKTLSILPSSCPQPISYPLFTCPTAISFSSTIMIFILVIFSFLQVLKSGFLVPEFLAQIGVVFSWRMSKNFRKGFHKHQLSCKAILSLSSKEFLVQVSQLWLVW